MEEWFERIDPQGQDWREMVSSYNEAIPVAPATVFPGKKGKAKPKRK